MSKPKSKRTRVTPVRTVTTLEEAVKEFVDSYQLHSKPNSGARFVDPRQCRACVETFENMVRALRDPIPRVLAEEPEEDNEKIVKLWP